MASAKFSKHWTEQGPDFKFLKSLPSGTVRPGMKLPCGFGVCGGIPAQATVPRTNTSERNRDRPIVSAYVFNKDRKVTLLNVSVIWSNAATETGHFEERHPQLARIGPQSANDRESPP